MAKRICGRRLPTGGICTRPAGCSIAHGVASPTTPVVHLQTAGAWPERLPISDVLGMDKAVLRDYADYRYCDPELLQSMLQVQDVTLWRTVAANPNAPLSVIEEMALSDDATTKQAVAGNPATPSELLVEVAQGTTQVSVIAAAVANPNYPVDYLKVARQSTISTIWMAALANPNFSEPYAFVDASASGDHLAGMTRNPKAPVALLETIIESDSVTPTVRALAYAHPSVPSRFLQATEESGWTPSIRLAIARNPSAPAETLALLGLDSWDSSTRRAAVLGNPGCPESLARRILAEGESKYLDALIIVDNPGTTNAMLQHLLVEVQDETIADLVAMRVRGTKRT